MNKKILILFAHPKFENSRIHKQLITAAKNHPDVYIRDLYQEYPNFNIDIKKEQELLLKYDIILWQHPVYWYSCPPLLKQWIDLVLTYGWAYGDGGNKLEGKLILNVVSTGGRKEAYSKDGGNKFSLNEFFLAFQQTATLCKMNYLPPFAIQGSHKLTESEIGIHSKNFQLLLTLLQNGLINSETSIPSQSLLNEFILTLKS